MPKAWYNRLVDMLTSRFGALCCNSQWSQHVRFFQAQRALPPDEPHFGAWVDLGVGFPALLEIIVIAGLTPERYRAGDWCPVGSEVSAFVGGFHDDSHQVGLWQVPVGRGRAEPCAAADSPRRGGFCYDRRLLGRRGP